jgi:aldose 1-epimerase
MKPIALALLLALPMIAAASPNKGMQPSVAEAPFGVLEDGGKVSLYTLANASGAEVRIINYGAIVVSLKVPDRAGKLRDVVLGYDDLAGYVKDKAFLGATVGRYANRIAAGKFTLDGKTYQLDLNNGLHHLHGGAQGFYRKLWKAEKVAGKGGPGVKLTCVSKDGEGGYPGKVTLTVTYTLTPDNALRIDYQGTSDKPTILNPTHHSYFNLSGDPTQTILDEELTIDADQTTAVGAGLIPTGKLAEVAGTPLDFRRPVKIGTRIDASDEQLVLGKGYDHNWVLRHHERQPGGGVHKAAELFDPRSGIVMQVLTDQPGLQFYSGNFLDGTIHGKGGVVYQRRTALCLEAQLFPDAPNHPSFPSAELRPGHPYKQTTIYKFSTTR